MALPDSLANHLEVALLEELRFLGEDASRARFEPGSPAERGVRAALSAIVRDSGASRAERRLSEAIERGEQPPEALLEQRVREALEHGLDPHPGTAPAPAAELPRVVAFLDLEDRGVDRARIAALVDRLSGSRANEPLLVLLDRTSHEALAYELQMRDESFRRLPPSARVVELEDGWARGLLEFRATLAAHRPLRTDAPGASVEPDPSAREAAPEADAALPDRAPAPGRVLRRRYRVLGSGRRTARGARFPVRDELESDRPLELVRIDPACFGGGGASRAAFGLFCERRVALDHPSLVRWHATGADASGGMWFIRDVLEGDTLRQRVERDGPLPRRTVARHLAEVLEALATAREAGLAHLDLEPGGIRLVPSGAGEARAVVSELGLAALLGPPRSARSAGPSETHQTWASATGGHERVTGTPAYVAPERAAHMLGRSVADEDRADLFSAGCVALFAATGEPPAHADLAERAAGRVPSAHDVGDTWPAAWRKALAGLLASEPGERFEDADEAARRFARLARGGMSPERVAGAAKVAAVAAVAVGLGLLAWRERGVGAGAGTLEAERWTFGPATPSRSLDADAQRALFAGELPEPRTALGLVDADGVRLEGWRVRWSDADELLVQAPLTWPDEVVRHAARFRVHGGDTIGPPLELLWIGAGAWDLGGFELAGTPLEELGERSLEPDPLAAFAFELAGRGLEHVSLVRATAGGDERTLVPVAEGDGMHRFEVPLGVLAHELGGLVDGRLRFAITARDGGGREERFELDRSVCTEPLQLLEDPLLVAREGDDPSRPARPLMAHAPGEWLFDPARTHGIVVPVAKAVRVRWECTTADGRTASGASDPVPGTPLWLDELTTLGAPPFAEAILRFTASDAPFVWRTRPRETGEVTGSFVLLGHAGPALFDVSHASAAGVESLEDGASVAIARPHLALTIDRSSPGELTFEVRTLAKADDEARELRVALADGEPRAELELDFDRPGRHRVEIRAARALPGDRGHGPRGEPLWFEVLVDPRAPVLELEGLEAGRVFRATDGPRLALGVVLVEEQPDDGAVTVTWSLAHEDSQPEVRGEMEVARGARGASLDLELPWRPAEEGRDGLWTLEVGARDAAGNVSEPLSLRLEVSVRGPAVRLGVPDVDDTWRADAQSLLFPLALEAADPNGVEDVTAQVFVPGAADEAREVELRRDDEGLWLGEVELPQSWSERSVRVGVRAADRAGTTTEQLYGPFAVGTVIPPRPDQVDRLGGHPTATMRLVEGNAELPYLFGGRDDVRENTSFALAGLEPFNLDPRKSLPRGWSIEYPPGAIADFLLDRTEVTRGAFLEFVRAGEHGYGLLELWPVGSADPSEARRLAWVAELSSGDARLPVTGVTWEEASAYAAWVGKRLPSWVELEYAMRGGARYHPYAGYAPSRPLGTEARAEALHAGHPAASVPHAPRPVDELTDETLHSGHVGLAGNVAEWTATPVWFGEVPERAVPSSHARQHVARLLRPEGFLAGNAPPELWAAGGHYRGRAFDFSAAEARGRRDRSPTIGFRCALSLPEYRARESSGEPVPAVALLPR